MSIILVVELFQSLLILCSVHTGRILFRKSLDSQVTDSHVLPTATRIKQIEQGLDRKKEFQAPTLMLHEFSTSTLLDKIYKCYQKQEQNHRQTLSYERAQSQLTVHPSPDIVLQATQELKLNEGCDKNRPTLFCFQFDNHDNTLENSCGRCRPLHTKDWKPSSPT